MSFEGFSPSIGCVDLGSGVNGCSEHDIQYSDLLHRWQHPLVCILGVRAEAVSSRFKKDWQEQEQAHMVFGVHPSHY